MARARNIKPAFFVNDDLSDCEPLARLLFIGLWTIADCEGRLKDRPRQIKAQILPYDECDTDLLLINLEQSGFIQRYRVQGQPVIQVIHFSKHQNPHKNEREKGSVFSTYDQRDDKDKEKQVVMKESSKIEINPDKDGTNRADSLLPITDSLNPITDSLVLKDEPLLPNKKENEVKDVFDFWKERLNHPRSNLDDKRKALIKKTLKAGYSVDDLKSAINGCSNTPHNMGDNDRGQRYDSIELILRDSGQIDRFMGNDALQPVTRSQANKKTSANVAAAQQFLKGDL